MNAPENTPDRPSQAGLAHREAAAVKLMGREAPLGSDSDDIWKAWHLDARVSAVQEAVKRARVAFFVCVFAASASAICLWNTYFSWDRGFGFSSFTANAASPHDDLMREQLRTWVDSQSVTVNLLGIHIAVSDFAVLNSAAQYFFVMYLLLALRRENREIGQLLCDVHSHIHTVGRAVFSAISAYMIFNLNRSDDREIRTLANPRDLGEHKIRFIRLANRVMFHSPFIVIVLTILCDFASLFYSGHLLFSSPIRPAAIISAIPTGTRIYAVSMEVTAVVFAALVFQLTRNALRYETATRDVLEEFKQELVAAKVVPPTEAEA